MPLPHQTLPSSSSPLPPACKCNGVGTATWASWSCRETVESTKFPPSARWGERRPGIEEEAPDAGLQLRHWREEDEQGRRGQRQRKPLRPARAHVEEGSDGGLCRLVSGKGCSGAPARHGPARARVLPQRLARRACLRRSSSWYLCMLQAACQL
eukprot:765703-Hanusia_phi.AAC.4